MDVVGREGGTAVVPLERVASAESSTNSLEGRRREAPLLKSQMQIAWPPQPGSDRTKT